MSYKINKYLNISLSYLTSKDKELLETEYNDDIPFNTVDKIQYGYLVSVFSDINIALIEDIYSKKFIDIYKKAIELEVDRIEFDEHGEKYEEFS
jgi:hypothetical protein